MAKEGIIIAFVLFMCVVMSILSLAIGVVGASHSFSASPSPSPTPSEAQAPSPSTSPDSNTKSKTETVTEPKKNNDGRCGPNHGNKKCTGKQCCSKSGWCGGEKGVNSNWCVNIRTGWWSGKYDGEEKAPDAEPIEVKGGYMKHKRKFLPSANGTDVHWKTGSVRPSPARKVKKASDCIAKCDKYEKCKGFTYKHAILEYNRRCWLKTDKVKTETLTDSEIYDTYIKK